MIMRLAQRANAFVERVFPERQIYHRTEGRVRYLTLSTRTQLLMASASAVAITWVSYATLSVLLNGHILNEQSAEAAQLKAKYERWLSEARAREASALALLQTRTTDFEAAASEFERRHNTLKGLLDHVVERDTPGRSVAVREEGGDAVLMMASREDPTPRQARPTPAPQMALNNFAGAEQLASMMSEQAGMLDQAERSAQARAENLRAVLNYTGVSADAVLGEADRGQGGPFVGLQASGVNASDPFYGRYADVVSRVNEVDRLERAIASAPLGAPVGDTYRVTSGFGPRIDPIRNRPAFHGGMDFGAYRLAPITAAAPGRVSFVGWRGGYGRVVEVDHGHGFRTRYGHLHRANVRRGDEVNVGDRIGGMGSTGRSTGNHLHYEVWFKGKQYDPSKFLKAGQYVQQG